MKTLNGNLGSWTIEFHPDARRDLSKLDRHARKRIDRYITDRILSLDDPRQKGKALRGEMGELWCYRVGDYRIICQIEDHRLVVVIVDIGHRRDIYR